MDTSGLKKYWTITIGNFQGPFALPSTKRKEKKIMNIIKEQEGFVGIHLHPPEGTLLLFKTENNAKKARNVLRAEGVLCGKNICEVYADADE